MTETTGRLHQPPWQGTLHDALELAEGAVAAYYAISPREWGTRFRYDVESAAAHPELAFHPGALAQIALVEPGGSDRPARFRIVLQDEAILELGAREGLLPVLAYTFAHELVHLVRFASQRVPFDLPADAIEDEERTVRALTLRILAPVLGEEARPLLERLALPS